LICVYTFLESKLSSAEISYLFKNLIFNKLIKLIRNQVIAIMIRIKSYLDKNKSIPVGFSSRVKTTGSMNKKSKQSSNEKKSFV
jgi:phosphoribosylaminoimidazole-succinocarboxamide synthase